MSAMSAYFLAHDAHRADSRAAEASFSRRSSLNPFHRNSYSETHPVTEPERGRFSVVEFVKKVKHGMGSHEDESREQQTARRESEENVSEEEIERRLNEVY